MATRQAKQVKTFQQLSHEIGQMVQQKRVAYGYRAQHVLRALYPDGIPAEQVVEGLWVARVVDKLCRIAHGKGKEFSEDAWADIAGYALVNLHDQQADE